MSMNDLPDLPPDDFSTEPPDVLPDDMRDAFFGEMPDESGSGFVVENGAAPELSGFAPAARSEEPARIQPGARAGGDGAMRTGVREMRATPAKAIPANLEAEQAVLGSLLIDPDAIVKIASFLRPKDFYRERHAWLYEAMFSLHERHEPLDFITVVDELERRGQIEEIGGPAFIADLISTTPTAMYVDFYARIVERTAVLRRLITAATEIVELAYDESQEVDQVVDRAEQIIFNVSESRIHRDLTPIRAIMGDVIDNIDFLSRHQDQLMGVPTGFALLDRYLGGLQKSDLIILAARPAMGKTSLALNIAQNAAAQNQRVAVFSLEMSSEQLVHRLLSTKTGIDSHRLRLGAIDDENEWTILITAANDLANTGIYIDDTPAASVTEIRTKARRLYSETGLDLILIDYMQLMSGQSGAGFKNENRQQEISFISRSLKSLARELNVPVIALSQLSRAVESRADKRPMLSDLRESGSIEQDADVVLFIYRDDYYDEASERQNIADVIIAKHRHGSTGTISLLFRKELTQFSDLEIQRTELP